MSESYFVIYNSDGDTKVDQLTRDELTKRLDDDYYGSRDQLGDIHDGETTYWSEELVIIKGKIVTPRPVNVVTKHAIE